MNGRKFPLDPHQETEERFNRLLKAMATEPEATTASESPSEELEKSGEVSDEDCSDIQSPTNTSEDASSRREYRFH